MYMSKRILYLLGFAITVMWAMYERSKGIEITDQIAICAVFMIAMLWTDD